MKTTIIDGKEYALLVCDFREERIAEVKQKAKRDFRKELDGLNVVHATCKHVGVEVSRSKRHDAVLVQRFTDGDSVEFDATTYLDTDGATWVSTDAGLKCPGCMTYLHDDARLATDNVNPFTGQVLV